MYVATNRFRVAAGREEDFERAWRERESYLDEVPGFLRFALLRADTAEGETAFVSFSEWESRAAFEAWTNSEAFVKAHRGARMPEGVVLAHPRFEGFQAVEL
jgi:heme-degrading monooxygenase HmoA